VKKKRKSATGGKTDDRPDPGAERLERFLSAPLAERASQGLSDRISIALHVDGEDFFFGRENGKNTLGRVETRKPDVHFWVHLSTLRHLLALAESPETGIATIGIAIFEHVFTKDESRKIKFRVDAGFLGLWGKGYFSVLKAGGPEVASYLARFGFHGLGAIKEVLKKVRT
jgi:hypothetical protein